MPPASGRGSLSLVTSGSARKEGEGGIKEEETPEELGPNATLPDKPPSFCCRPEMPVITAYPSCH